MHPFIIIFIKLVTNFFCVVGMYPPNYFFVTSFFCLVRDPYVIMPEESRIPLFTHQVYSLYFVHLSNSTVNWILIFLKIVKPQQIGGFLARNW